MTKHTYDLIETVAEQLAQALLLEFKLVKSVLLEIRKPHAPIEKEFESVSVEIERGWHEAFVAFGSNLGDKEKFIDEAIEALSNLPQINIVAISDKIVTEPYGNVEIAGMVGLYEICFEQSWKAMKELLENFGYAEGATGSPRTILKTAYKAGMISDEELWLDALVSRNNVAHAYNQAIAMDIIRQTKEKYYDMFIQLEKKIEQDWL